MGLFRAGALLVGCPIRVVPYAGGAISRWCHVGVVNFRRSGALLGWCPFLVVPYLRGALLESNKQYIDMLKKDSGKRLRKSA